jgi:hypothetical protein
MIDFSSTRDSWDKGMMDDPQNSTLSSVIKPFFRSHNFLENGGSSAVRVTRVPVLGTGLYGTSHFLIKGDVANSRNLERMT